MKLVTKGKIPESRKEEYAEFDTRCASLYRSGLSTYQVAKELKVTQGAVARSLRRSKTKRRSISDAMLLRAAA